MPIIPLFIGLFLPRVAIALLWLFTSWLSVAYQTLIIPVLGFIFLPYTTLLFAYFQNMGGVTWSLWQSLFLILAAIVDLSSYSSIGGTYRKRA